MRIDEVTVSSLEAQGGRAQRLPYVVSVGRLPSTPLFLILTSPSYLNDCGLREQSYKFLRSSSLRQVKFNYTSLTMPDHNITGFNLAEYKAAASPSSSWAKRDPWARKYVD